MVQETLDQEEGVGEVDSPKQGKYLLINKEKVTRAKNIIEICGRQARNATEVAIQERWSGIVGSIKKGVDPVEEIYRSLGGLVRTPQQQQKAEVVAKQVKAKADKVKAKSGRGKKGEEDEE